MRIEQVEAAVTFPLRQRVLRPGDTVDELAASAPKSIHFAALDSHKVIGAVSVAEARVPWSPAQPGVWRLRGIATA